MHLRRLSANDDDTYQSTIEPSSPFGRTLAHLLLATYKRRLRAIVAAAPAWVSEEILSASERIGDRRAVLYGTGSVLDLKKIYFDTNQFYYIRRIAEEAEGWDYGNYDWAYRIFPDDPELVQDIRALCYIVALQYEWDLDFSSSNASFTEVSLSTGKRAQATRDAWVLFAEGLEADQSLRRVPFLPDRHVSGRLSLGFIEDPDDRVIIRHFAAEGADVLLTSDNDILKHRAKLAELNLTVMRPSEWLNAFLENARGSEDAVDWLERILFGVGT